MVYAITLAHNQLAALDGHRVAIPELLLIGSIAGHEFLASLDKLLKPQQLKNCTKNHLQSLFLMVLGTILAAGYTRPPALNTTSVMLNQFHNTRNFLCQILAHYLLYLGSQLRLSVGKQTEQFILQGSPARWNKRGLFQWTTAPCVESSPCRHDVEQDLVLEDMSEFNWLASSGLIVNDFPPTSDDQIRPAIPSDRTTQDLSVPHRPRKPDRSARSDGSSNRAKFGYHHSRQSHTGEHSDQAGYTYGSQTLDNRPEAISRMLYYSVNTVHPLL